MSKFRKKPVVIEAREFTGFNWPELDEWIGQNQVYPQIKTLEGIHHVSVGDWVIKGVKGEFYPCKPDIFEQTYEKAD